jgi:hypothetical protein
LIEKSSLKNIIVVQRTQTLQKRQFFREDNSSKNITIVQRTTEVVESI